MVANEWDCYNDKLLLLRFTQSDIPMDNGERLERDGV